MFGDTEQKLTPLTKVAVFPPLRLPPMIALIRIPEVLAVRAGGSDLHTNTLPRRVEVVPFSSEGALPPGGLCSVFGHLYGVHSQKVIYVIRHCFEFQSH